MVVELLLPNEFAEVLRAEGRAIEAQIALDLAISSKVVRPFSLEDLAEDLA